MCNFPTKRYYIRSGKYSSSLLMQLGGVINMMLGL